MKFRTDFVTNSSSSSFCVEITFTTVNGKNCTDQWPDEGCIEDGVGDANMTCKAADIARVESFEELTQLLSSSVKDTDEDIDYSDGVRAFCNRAQKRIKDFSQIKTITLKRKWSSYGEGFSGFCYDKRYYPEELYNLASKVCKASGTEKESAKEDLARYLRACDIEIEGDSSPHWPTGFLGEKPPVTFVIDEDRWEDMEEVAQAIVNGSFGPFDDIDKAEETVTIDMQSKQITASAEYFL